MGNDKDPCLITSFFNEFVLKLPASCLAMSHELKGKYLAVLTTIHMMSD